MTGREQQLPKLAARLLERVLTGESRDAVLGDFEEGFRQVAAERGLLSARIWYWRNALQAFPAFSFHALQTPQLRRQTVNGNTLFREGKGTAAIGALLLMPALMLVIPGPLLSVFGKAVEASLNSIPGMARFLAWIDQPGLVLGGLALGLAINLLAVTRVKIDGTDYVWRATVTLKKSAWNLVLIGLAVFLSSALFFYFIGENILPLLPK